MKLKLFLIPLFVMCYSPSVYADGLDISYTVPFVPLEIVFDSDGISFRGTKTIVTPIGSFSLGYSKYASKFDEDYTYVIIEDMNLRKEHIYKIKDKKKLKLLTEGRTEITITKNRVRIVVEKGSRFKVSFSVEGAEDYSSSSKWITPKDSVCRANAGKIDDNGVCKAKWKEAKQICSVSGGRLPTIEELKRVVTDCGGEMEKDNDVTLKRNKDDSQYQNCYKKKGFAYRYYWSSTTHANNSDSTWFVYFGHGGQNFSSKNSNYYVRCVRAGE